MKKQLTFLLALISASAMTATAFAQTLPPIGQDVPEIVVYTTPNGDTYAQGDLRFSYLSSVSAQISRSGSKANCTSTVSNYSGKTILLQVELQQSPQNRNSWSTIQTWSTRVTKKGATAYAPSGNIVSGYDYRTVAEAYVLDDDETILEKGTAISGKITY